MKEQEAKYTIIEYKPIVGFEKYREALDIAIRSLETQTKLKECIANLDNPEFAHLTWSHEEVLKLLKEHVVEEG